MHKLCFLKLQIIIHVFVHFLDVSLNNLIYESTTFGSQCQFCLRMIVCNTNIFRAGAQVLEGTWPGPAVARWVRGPLAGPSGVGDSGTSPTSTTSSTCTGWGRRPSACGRPCTATAAGCSCAAERAGPPAGSAARTLWSVPSPTATDPSGGKR